MNKLKLVLSGILILTISGVSTLPAVAHNGEDHSSNNTSKTAEEIAEYKAAQKAETERKKAEQILAEKMAAAQTKAKETRTKACEARKENIKQRWTKISEFAGKHKGSFENVLNRIVEFKNKNSLVVPNEEELFAAIDAAKTEVAENLAALESLRGTVDCSDPDSVASGIEAYKSQVKNLVTSLKAYRETIRDYAQAVKNAASSAQDGDQ